MKALRVVLLLSFAATQSLFWVDCCCGSFCTAKNACTPEEASTEDSHEEACFHLEPQSDLTPAPVEAFHIPVAFESDLSDLFETAVFVPVVRLSHTLDPGLLPAPPLHLRLRVLLI